MSGLDDKSLHDNPAIVKLAELQAAVMRGDMTKQEMEEILHKLPEDIIMKMAKKLEQDSNGQASLPPDRKKAPGLSSGTTTTTTKAPTPDTNGKPQLILHDVCGYPTLDSALAVAAHEGIVPDPLRASLCLCELGAGTLRGCDAMSTSYRRQRDPQTPEFGRALGTLLLVDDQVAAGQGLPRRPVLQRLAGALRSWGNRRTYHPVPDLSLAYHLIDGTRCHVPGYETGRHVWVRVNSHGVICEGAAQKVDGYFSPVGPPVGRENVPSDDGEWVDEPDSPPPMDIE
ncbi:hypothetical protein MN608_01595 [Microdochium nivale]|nr:hypothetical protein MN608_01595 [Microdochium nivale]